jgi:hypothetical protein
LVADHVAAGSFKTAALLLKEQLGIVCLKPFKSVILHAYARYFLKLIAQIFDFQIPRLLLRPSIDNFKFGVPIAKLVRSFRQKWPTSCNVPTW